MLIVNPNNRNPSPFSAVEPPLWAGLTASYHNADILDAEAEELTIEETERAIRNSGHKDIIIVVMGNNPSVSSTPKMPIAEALADRIKDLNVSLTGLHPIAVGSRYPVITQPFREFPKVQWWKLPMNLYVAHNWQCLDGTPRSRYASVYTSLGCPFNCYYCNIHTLYGGERKVRFRPVKDVLKELHILRDQYKVRNIKIWDELFAFDAGRLHEFGVALRHYDFNMWAYARLDTITEHMLISLRMMGIKWLAYGFESVKDQKMTECEDVIKMTREYGINIIANFMFGLPNTTRDDDQRSLEFAMKHLFEYVNFYDAKPYPGSKWWADTKLNVEFDQYKQISPFRQEAFQTYFTNPDYLSMLRKKWGVQAVRRIEEMRSFRFENPISSTNASL